MENKPEEKKDKKISIDIDDVISQGIYSNLAICNVSEDEFVLDFAFLQPPLANRGRIKSRIILSPKNAKRLAKMLAANIANYEAKMGVINDDGGPQGIKFSFN